VADALLHIAFDEGYDGELRTAAQRQVTAAIAASDRVWTFNVNLFEVLRDHDLPADRDKLHALAAETPAGETPGK
jgi:hypothetical protein